MRRSRGLPYGWWKNPDFWAVLIFGIPAVCMLEMIIAAWFFDWKPWW